ncbi:MAG: hypothetical protein KKE43_00020, partial [Actinobacteria bacterium]|nr:hypothetical protein [Actinomycetota bacterium]
MCWGWSLCRWLRGWWWCLLLWRCRWRLRGGSRLGRRWWRCHGGSGGSRLGLRLLPGGLCLRR